MNTKKHNKFGVKEIVFARSFAFDKETYEAYQKLVAADMNPNAIVRKALIARAKEIDVFIKKEEL